MCPSVCPCVQGICALPFGEQKGKIDAVPADLALNISVIAVTVTSSNHFTQVHHCPKREKRLLLISVKVEHGGIFHVPTF